MPKIGVHPTVVCELDDGQSVDFGETHVTAMLTPGHTTGSVCYRLQRPDLSALFTGDVVQGLSRGRSALGTYTAYMAPRYRGDARAFLTTLRRLRALPVPDLVLPGHPITDPSPQRPRLSEQHWHALLDPGIAEMEKLIARYDADGAAFLDGTPRELLPKLRYFGDLGGRAVYCLDGPKGLLLFDAPGGPELVKFLADRFTEVGWGGRKVAAVLLTSVDDEATAGLAALVKEMGCPVVTANEGLDAVRRRCPDGTAVLSEDALDKGGWLEGKAIPLAGRGLAPLAYQLKWAGKTVLVSGDIPIKLTVPGAKQLLDDLKKSGGDTAKYLQALDRLAEVNPNVWLPAAPALGQNANLYDEDWADVLAQNRQLIALNARGQ
jgi:glyoxylase-like metal-dependent hydrolase (beta-lactamase superfamily II)